MREILQHIVLGLLLVAGPGIGAVLLGGRAWYLGTKALDDRIDVSEKAEDMSNRYYRHIIRQGRRRRRLIKTIMGALLGAAIGLAVVFAFALLKRR